MTNLRTDIQALRGFAVLLVVAYHAGLPGLKAGYLGVDLFFVISGFLITGMIARGLESQSFSFSDFYFRRAKRLLPAAYVVIFGVIFIAPFTLSDVEMRDLRDQVVGAVTFTANFVLWGQTGYFEGAADSKPLLHFWSLAIEEQYYLIMPLILFVFPRKNWLIIIIGIAIVSFSCSIYISQTDPDFAFYLPFTRLWELAIGSIGALLPAGRFNILHKIKPFCIVLLIFLPFFPTGYAHPGLDAFLVCIATIIVILTPFGNENIRSNAPLKLLVNIGNISYSLYLVHWPILVYNRHLQGSSPSVISVVISVIIAFALAYILHRHVEEPLRRRESISKSSMIASLLATSVALIAGQTISAAMTASPYDFENLRRQAYGISRKCAFGTKFIFDGSVPDHCRTKADAKVLVWGDSYAMAWTSGLVPALDNVGVEQVTMAACEPLFRMARFSKDPGDRYNEAYARSCIAHNDKVLDYIRQRQELEVIVLAGRFQTILSSGLMLVRSDQGYSEQPRSIELAADGLKLQIEQIRAAGKKVIVLPPPPADGSEIGDCLEEEARARSLERLGDACRMALSDVKAYRSQTSDMLNLVQTRTGVALPDSYSFLCGDQAYCRTHFDGILLYRDSGHLTVEGSKLIVDKTDLAETILRLAN